MKEKISEEIEIPEGIEVEIAKMGEVKIKGPKGEAIKLLKHPKVSISKKENKIKIASLGSRHEKKIVNTFKAHIHNLMKGVKELYVYELKICSGHFPITVEMKDNKLIVKNFLGGKIAKQAKILPNVKVVLKGDIITIESTNKESAGETASNIERSTRIVNRDRRRFQDGIYITKKEGIPIR